MHSIPGKCMFAFSLSRMSLIRICRNVYISFHIIHLYTLIYIHQDTNHLVLLHVRRQLFLLVSQSQILVLRINLTEMRLQIHPPYHKYLEHERTHALVLLVIFTPLRVMSIVTKIWGAHVNESAQTYEHTHTNEKTTTKPQVRARARARVQDKLKPRHVHRPKSRSFFPIDTNEPTNKFESEYEPEFKLSSNSDTHPDPSHSSEIPSIKTYARTNPDTDTDLADPEGEPDLRVCVCL